MLSLSDAALEPVAQRLSPDRLAVLRTQLAALLGMEPLIVYRDICGLSVEEAKGIATQTALTLLRAALKDGLQEPRRSGLHTPLF